MQSSDRKYSVFIDWLRFTVPYGVEFRYLMPLMPCFEPSGEVLTPFPNYTGSMALVCGRIDWNDDRPEQRVMVTLTGQDLARMRDTFSDVELLRDIAKIEGIRITRLDLATDTNDTRISPAELKKDWKTERFKTRAKMLSEIRKEGKEGEYQGHTVYIGSRQSEQFLRVYDKAAESGQEGHLTRVELELKGHKAFEALHTIVRVGEAEGVFAAYNRFFAWLNGGWQDVVSNTSEKVEKLAQDKPDKHREWLLKVALPAVIEAVEGGDEHVRQILIDALSKD